ncbi:MAG TPA: alpha/beta hydrolase [archaeon]|nr:alpha/beta hydrolase [archaeon]
MAVPRRFRIAVPILVALIFCAAAGFADKIEKFDGITLERDIVFGNADGYELKLDIAYATDSDSAAPAIVHIHGGAWRTGRKSADRALGFARAGFVGVSINYRLSGVAQFPAGVYDCKRAIRWVRANAARYGIDPERIGIVGESAGGHLVALLGTSGGCRYLEGYGGDLEYSSSVQSVVDHYGPVDFLRMEDKPGRMRHLTEDSPESLWLGQKVTEVPELVRMANPITYIDAGDPPMLLIHGENDGIVIIEQSEYLYEALRKAGVECEFIRVANADHGYPPNPKDAVVSPSREEIRKKEIEWFKRTLVK